MKKYFVFSDAHSCYTSLINALIAKGFDENNSEHFLISLGDNFDRGDESYEMLQFIKKYIELNRIVLVRGNHETLMLEMLKRKKALAHDYHNRTLRTYWDLSASDIFEFENLNDTNVLKQFKYIDKYSTWYYELGQYIFVHGFIPCLTKFDINSGYYEPTALKGGYLTRKDWDNASWINGFKAYTKGLKIANKTLVCGHIGTYLMHGDKTNFGEYRSPDGDFIGIDGTTAYSGIVNVLVIDESEIDFASKPYFKTNTKH